MVHSAPRSAVLLRSARCDRRTAINPFRPAPPLHPGRKRELIKLVRDFTQQHDDGVCKIHSYRQLVKLSYPKAPEDEAHAMLEFIESMKSFEEAAIQAAEERRREIEALFMSIDTDGGGTIDLDEFLQLNDSTGYSAEYLTRLFHAKDADGSGEINMDEFVSLLESCDLISKRQAIIKHSTKLKEERRSNQQISALLMLSLEKRSAKEL